MKTENYTAVDLLHKTFTEPFVWSATQSVQFFLDPKMANLLTGQPL